MWFNSHKKMWIFVRYVDHKSLPSKFYTSALNILKECEIQSSLCSASFLSVKIRMEGTYDTPYKNYYFWTNSDGVFAKMQITSYNFIILKQFTVSKDIDAENPITTF